MAEKTVEVDAEKVAWVGVNLVGVEMAVVVELNGEV